MGATEACPLSQGQESQAPTLSPLTCHRFLLPHHENPGEHLKLPQEDRPLPVPPAGHHILMIFAVCSRCSLPAPI